MTYQPTYAHLDALLVDMQDATRPSDISESPAFRSIIRAAQADAWHEGAQWAAVDLGAIRHRSNGWAADSDNPYREDTTA